MPPHDDWLSQLAYLALVLVCAVKPLWQGNYVAGQHFTLILFWVVNCARWGDAISEHLYFTMPLLFVHSLELIFVCQSSCVHFWHSMVSIIRCSLLLRVHNVGEMSFLNLSLLYLPLPPPSPRRLSPLGGSCSATTPPSSHLCSEGGRTHWLTEGGRDRGREEDRVTR